MSDVAKTLRDIDAKKATGWDAIPSKTFKIGSSKRAVSLCGLYNRCMVNSCWPKDWKRDE